MRWSEKRMQYRRRKSAHITTGVACATLPTSSSFCIIFLIRACSVPIDSRHELPFHIWYLKKSRDGQKPTKIKSVLHLFTNTRDKDNKTERLPKKHSFAVGAQMKREKKKVNWPRILTTGNFVCLFLFFIVIETCESNM